jgi:putative acetyltransferase
MKSCMVRRAMPDDALAICNIHRSSVRGLCAAAYGPRQIEAWLDGRVADDFRNAMTHGGETIFVAQRAERIVGFASIKAETLMGLYVDPDGGRVTGRALLRAAAEHARSAGVAVLSLQATLNAILFYEQHGFLPDRPGSVVRGGFELPVVEMSKKFDVSGWMSGPGGRRRM